MIRLPNTACLLLAAGLLALPTSAAVIQTSVFTEGSSTTYDANASNSDLINQGALTLGSSSSTLSGTWSESGINDGSATVSGPTGDYAYWDAQTAVTLTYELTGSDTGYDITSINSIYGFAEGRRHAAQYYSVFVATVDDPTYNLLYTVAYDPSDTPQIEVASQVTLTDDTGTLASGVIGIQFALIEDPGGLYDEVGVIHEIDVFGLPTVPEPSSLALIAAGGLALVSRRRR